MAPIRANDTVPTGPGRGPLLRAGLAACAAALLALASFTPATAQFEAVPEDLREDAHFSAYPTIQGIREARWAGHPPERILAWIRDHEAVFSLDLDEAIQLHAEGIETTVVAAMAGMPVPEVEALLGAFDKVFLVRPGPREGLSKRRLLKMLEYRAPEEEILAAIAEKGSRAEFSLSEAVDLLDQGASPRLVAAMARGVVPAGAPRSWNASTDRGQGAPTLDEILAGTGEAEESGPVLLDDLFREEGVEEEAEEPGAVLLDDLFREEGVEEALEGGPRLVVLSDPPGAPVFLAPATIRPVDLLAKPRPAGRTPVDLKADPGSFYVIVEKALDAFDAELIPALRTVHDGEGTTRTLIHAGTLYYDVQDCCQPKGLGGAVEITRIGENQPGILLGDEFDGMPPYLWDGNRFLILKVEGGRVERILKVYLVTRAAGEERTLMATFIPSSADPLAHPASMESVSTRARSTWEVPEAEDLAAVARMNGVPESEVQRIQSRLVETGKAVWKEDTGDRVRILSLELDSLGRTRLHDVELRREGLFGMLATPRQSDPAKAHLTAAAQASGKEPKPIPALIMMRDPDVDLPILEVSNRGSAPAMVRLGDGTLLLAAPGETVSSTVSPGTHTVEARFEGKEGDLLHGRKRFSYHARYSLSLQ